MIDMPVFVINSSSVLFQLNKIYFDQNQGDILNIPYYHDTINTQKRFIMFTEVSKELATGAFNEIKNSSE